MKKFLFASAIAFSISLFSVSCGSDSQTNNADTPPDAAYNEPQKTPAPVELVKDTRPSSITVTPSEFGLTELQTTKIMTGDCKGEGNIGVDFELSFTDSISTSTDRLSFSGYDCGTGEGESSKDDGKRMKSHYDLLKKSKAQDLAITYIYGDGTWHPHKVVIKEKRTPSKDGAPSQVVAEVIIE